MVQSPSENDSLSSIRFVFSKTTVFKNEVADLARATNLLFRTNLVFTKIILS